LRSDRTFGYGGFGYPSGYLKEIDDVDLSNEESVMVEIIPIDTPSLGDHSYLAHDGEVALVVDPQRDLDRVLALADRHRVRITHVFETHVHND
jgi:hydroxyacylglutathione hydrolase